MCSSKLQQRCKRQAAKQVDWLAGMPLNDWRVFPFKVVGLPEDNVGNTGDQDALVQQLLKNPLFTINGSNPVPSAHGPTVYM